MREERLVFERRRKDYIDRARLALEVVNRTVEKFNSYGSCFCIWDKGDVKKKCSQEYIADSLSDKLIRDRKKGVSGENLRRHEYKYRLIEKELQEPAKAAREAIKTFGRLMVYDAENYIFILDNINLEKSALLYAEDLE